MGVVPTTPVSGVLDRRASHPPRLDVHVRVMVHPRWFEGIDLGIHLFGESKVSDLRSFEFVRYFTLVVGIEPFIMSVFEFLSLVLHRITQLSIEVENLRHLVLSKGSRPSVTTFHFYLFLTLTGPFASWVLPNLGLFLTGH